jgi:serine/threonine protein kinase/class 3 adenylate cyclase/Tfp pilus assembly protein PilF
MGEPGGEHLRLATLLASDLVDSTRLIERLGDDHAAEVFRRHDRLARDLLVEHHGREIDKTDGFLLMFGRPTDAVQYAIAFHDRLAELGAELGLHVDARIGIHVGEVMLRENAAADVGRGAKPIEIEGLAKPVVARVMSLGLGRQTLLTRMPFDLARRGALGTRLADQTLSWLAHGAYLAKGLEDPIEVFEVGRTGFAPLVSPAETEKVRRVADPNAIIGWRPAPGVEMPGRPNWILEERVGSGGFGDVWRGVHRKTGEQRVFKFCYDVLKLRALKREVTLVRLLKEELGDRRDIARIIDWNFDQVPYFIESEWTQAGSLDRWLKDSGGVAAVPPSVRTEIVAQVADALAAAHSVGVLHKDIKPSNILMTRDASGVPRATLTDFGIGLLTDRDRLDQAGITAGGFTAVALEDATSGAGTQLYMAPELLEGKPATVHADAYALGVILFQLVIGDLSRAVSEGWEREIEDPLLREDIAAAVEGHPEQRIDVRQLADRLRRLEPRRHEREQQAAAVHRAERARKRWTWISLAATALLLVAVATGIQLRRVAREAARANRAAVTSQRVSGFMTELFRLADPGEARGNSVTAREVLDEGARRIEGELKDQPEVQATLMASMGNAYLGLGLAKVAKPILEKSLAIRRRLFGDGAAETADVLIAMGEAEQSLGEYPNAEGRFAEAAAARTTLFGPAHAGVAQALEGVARARWRRGNLDSAAAAAQHAIEIYRSLGGHSAELAGVLSRLAVIRVSSGRAPEADSLLREALTLAHTVYGPEHRTVAQLMNNLGLVLTAEGKFAEAEVNLRGALAILKKLLGDRHPQVANSTSALATFLHQQRQYDQAETLFRESLAVYQALYGDQHPETAGTMTQLAWVLADDGRCAEAESLTRQSRAILQRVYQTPHWGIALAESILGQCLAARGQDREAEPLLLQSYTLIQKTQGGPWALAALNRIINYYDRRGNQAKAEEYRRLLPPAPSPR